MNRSLMASTEAGRFESAHGAQTRDIPAHHEWPRDAGFDATGDSFNGVPLMPCASLERRRSTTRTNLVAGLAGEESVRSAEQQRIGQQLHDDLGGVLTGLNACLSVLIERAARAGATPDPLLVDASRLGQIAFDTVRQVAKELRPPLLDYLGIWEAIAWHVNMLARRSAIDCQCVIAPAVRLLELGGAREYVIFRVVCEALANIERHARACAAVVSVGQRDGQILVSVVDDGIGFTEAHVGSLGLSGMQERARELGGSLSIRTISGHGTQLHLRVPLGCGNET